MNINILFNTIYIFESLGSINESHKKTGLNLHETTLRYLSFKRNSIQSVYYEVLNKTSFKESLTKVIDDCKLYKKRPYIHFEIHGNPKGLCLLSSEVVEWEILFNYLREINILCNNNLFISLATCFGANIISIIDINQKCPFVGGIGSFTEINERHIANNFEVFFNTLLEENDFNIAYSKLNESSPNKYILWTSNSIFDYIKSLYLQKDFEKKVDTVYNQLDKNDRNISKYNEIELKSFIRAMLQEDIPKELNKIKANFLMIDLQ